MLFARTVRNVLLVAGNLLCSERPVNKAFLSMPSPLAVQCILIYENGLGVRHDTWYRDNVGWNAIEDVDHLSTRDVGHASCHK